MGNLAQVQTSEVVSTVATANPIPNRIVATEPLDLPFINMRQTTPAAVATVFTPDLAQGSMVFITGTAGAFTIANPIDPPAQNANTGDLLCICIVNPTGGALGAITAGSQYKLVGAAFPVVATLTRRYIVFTNVGTQAAPVWSEVFRGAADTPN